MPFAHDTGRYQARRDLLARVAPVYQTASRAQKHLILNEVVKTTGYARHSAIRLLNHPPSDRQAKQRGRRPIYGPEVQQALFLAWKASHAVCAKRLLPALPSLIALLEQWGHLCLTGEHRRQVLSMSVSTAERLRPTPGVHGLSTTTAGSLRKEQLSVRTFSLWRDDQPGFVEMDLVAHGGSRVDGSFLYTLTLTDLATCWTECIPLLYKSADAVVAALDQARVLFPFPLRGIDTDSGSEFLNEELIACCEQHQLTFTRGRPGFKNDQAHVEQKNGAVVRGAVGCMRLEGVQAYHQLREVYRALRLVVNCFQPSFKLQEKVSEGGWVRRVYDVAQTLLQRLLASGVLPENQQEELRARVQQIDPLALSNHLYALRYALWCGAHLPVSMEAERPRLTFRLDACTSATLSASEAEPEQAEPKPARMSSDEILNWPHTTHDPFAGFWEEILALVQAHPEWTSAQIVQGIGYQVSSHLTSSPMQTLIQRLHHIHASLRATWEEPWPVEWIQGGTPERCPDIPPIPDQDVSSSDQRPTSASASQSESRTTEWSGKVIAEQIESGTKGGHSSGVRPSVSSSLAQAIEAYVHDLRERGRAPQTLAWHQTSLSSLQQYVWDQFQVTEVSQLSRAMLHRWLADLHTMRSSRTGATLSVNTMAAYARSGRAFCHWLVQRGIEPMTPFPHGSMPKARRCLPQLVEPTVFETLLRACQVPGVHAAGMTLRNRAILWFLRDVGLSVSEVCGLRLGDVDQANGTVTVRGKGGGVRTLLLSKQGRCAVSAYLEQARFTPAWSAATPEAREMLLLTEVRQPLTKNSLTLLFGRLSQRAGLTTKPIHPFILRDTSAIWFLQTRGERSVLQEQLGLADPASVRRYQHSCDQQRKAEPEAQAGPEGHAWPPRPARQSKGTRRKARVRG